MWKRWLVALVSCWALGPAFATLTFTFAESGGNVELAVSGSVNTTALTNTAGGASCSVSSTLAGVVPSTARVQLCSPGVSVQPYTGLSGPASVGAGAVRLATSNSGDAVFLYGSSGELYLPFGYVSGTPLSASATFNGTTIPSMGLTPGTYTWTFGSGPSADTVVVQISSVVTPPAAVNSIPTLGEFALMALAGLVFLSTLPALRRKS